MDNIRNKIISGDPAGYPATAATETESRNILMNLLNTKFIKGEIKVLDKYPNTDGILEITDVNQLPLGKIDVQLKTLQPKNYKKPCYQCERSFFVYCENSALPVILIVVNRTERKAYWRHIDSVTIQEVSEKIVGNSCAVSIPIENCIDGLNEAYISAWTEKAMKTAEKVWNYDWLHEQKKELDRQLAEMDTKFKTPTNLPINILKGLHNYLDKYNYILDFEFYSIKEILYPNYWKIGMGVLKFEGEHFRYVLYPIEYTKEQTLVKEVVFEEEDIFEEMSNGNIIVLAHSSTNADLMKYPLQKAYTSLEDSLMQTISKYNFPVKNSFLAQEYLISFIDRYCIYMDMEKDQQSYSIEEITFKLYSVLPMLAAIEFTYADWVKDCSHGIDSYSSWKTSEVHKKKIRNCIKKIEEGFVPLVKVTITSEIYSMDLLAYYINFLQSIGQNLIIRQYQSGQYNKEMFGVDFKKTWDKDILWLNTKTFFKYFFQIYETYITDHFSYLKPYLQIAESEISIVCIYISNVEKGGPYLELYSLRPYLPETSQHYCFFDMDPSNPIDREKFYLRNQFDCTLDGKKYQIVSMQVRPLNFMFEPSATYAFLKINLMEKFKKFFNSKKEKKSDTSQVRFLIA